MPQQVEQACAGVLDIEMALAVEPAGHQVEQSDHEEGRGLRTAQLDLLFRDPADDQLIDARNTDRESGGNVGSRAFAKGIEIIDGGQVGAEALLDLDQLSRKPLEEGEYLVPVVPVARHGKGDRFVEKIRGLAVDSGGKVLLGGVVIADAGLGQSKVRGDVLEPRRVDALGVEAFGGCREEGCLLVTPLLLP